MMTNDKPISNLPAVNCFFKNLIFHLTNLTFLTIKPTRYTGCFKKSFTTLKAYRNLYRGHTQRFELSKCSKTHRVLPRIVMVQCVVEFRTRITAVVAKVTPEMLRSVWLETDYRWDVCRITNGSHIEP